MSTFCLNIIYLSATRLLHASDLPILIPPDRLYDAEHNTEVESVALDDEEFSLK